MESRHTNLITLTLTGGRTERGRKEQRAVRQSHIGNQVSFCELKGHRGHSVHVCMCVCVLSRLRAQGLQSREGR